MIGKKNIHDDTIPWHSRAFYVAARYRVISSGAGCELDYVEIEPGGRILSHRSGAEEEIVILEGEGTFILDESHISCHAGDCLHAAAKSVSGIANGGQQVLRLLIIRAGQQDGSAIPLLALLRRLAGR